MIIEARGRVIEDHGSDEPRFWQVGTSGIAQSRFRGAAYALTRIRRAIIVMRLPDLRLPMILTEQFVLSSVPVGVRIDAGGVRACDVVR